MSLAYHLTGHNRYTGRLVVSLAQCTQWKWCFCHNSSRRGCAVFLASYVDISRGFCVYFAVQPPSIPKRVEAVHEDSLIRGQGIRGGVERISSGRPMRPSGWRACNCWRTSSSRPKSETAMLSTPLQRVCGRFLDKWRCSRPPFVTKSIAIGGSY